MPDPQEDDRASAAIRRALAERRDALAAASGLPPEDRVLSDRILGEARRRSETISARQTPANSSRRMAEGPGIPWWLHVAWIVAIAGAIAAWLLT